MFYLRELIYLKTRVINMLDWWRLHISSMIRCGRNPLKRSRRATCINEVGKGIHLVLLSDLQGYG